MVKILGFHCHGLGSIPGRGTEPGKKKKKSLSIGITCLVTRPNFLPGVSDSEMT